MNIAEILQNSYVITSGGKRLKQFRRLLTASGVDGSLPHEWKWCKIENEGSMGNAIAQYSLVRYAIETKLPFLVVFEDDAAPCNNVGEELEKIFNTREKDVLCISLGWNADSDPEKGSNRGDKRRVYGSHAYVLFGEKAYKAYIEAWEKNGRADVVLGLISNSKLADKNLFAQYTPTDNAIHLPVGWTLDASVEKIVDGELLDRYSKSRKEIEKIKRESEIHVAYTIDVQGNGAIPFMDQLLVSIYTLREFMDKKDRVCCHVLYGNITAELMRKLNTLTTERFRVEFTPIKEQDLQYMQTLTKHSPTTQFRSWSGIVFARIWLPLALPKLQRVIYLDTDTVITKSIRKLWETDLEGNLLGMVNGTVPEYGYNSGVILFDCDAIRKDEELYGKLSEFLSKYAKTFYCPDQTSINMFFAGKIKELDGIWNYPPMPGLDNTNGIGTAAIWHFYEGGRKPVRLGTDEFGVACLKWNKWLSRIDEETK